MRKPVVFCIPSASAITELGGSKTSAHAADHDLPKMRAAFEMGEAAGRPAALRRLLAEIEEDHTDEIAAWALAAPDPAERASFCQQEVGRRRRGPPRAKYEHLSRDEQQRIALRALARIRDEARRRDKVALMHDTTAKSEDDR